MKKRKFNLLLEIATLCLCVAAIAFGVYSAKSASLNVSGTLGFTAHNCNVIITPSYTCANSSEAGASVKTTTLDNVELGNPASQTSQNVAFNSLFFNDLVENGDKIVLTLKVENKSMFDVKITLGTLSYKNGENEIPEEKVTRNVTMTNEFLKDVNQTTEEKTSTITVTLTALNIDDATGIDGTLSLNVSFAKGSQYYTEKVIDKVYNSSTSSYEEKEVNKLYLTMGSVTINSEEIPVRWFAFAVQGIKQSDGTYQKPDFVPDTSLSITTGTNEKWYSLAGVDMASVNTKGQTFWFIQEKLIQGVQARYANETVYANDNKKSYVYKYLNSIDVSVGYKEALNLTNDNVKNITNRKVDEQFNYDWIQGNNKFESKFWLLNLDEIGLLVNNTIVIESYTNPYPLQMPIEWETIGSSITPGWVTRVAVGSARGYGCLAIINDVSHKLLLLDLEDVISVRTAFQITL